MKIPSKVKVGGIIYEVYLVDQCSDGPRFMGQVDHYKCEIQLRQNLNPQAKMQTLWHEITHIVISALGRKDFEEGDIEQVAQYIYQIVVDNPEMFRE